MKPNEQKSNNKFLTCIAVEALLVVIGLAGIALIAGDEDPNAAMPMTFGEWIAIKVAGIALVAATVIAGRAARRAGITY